MDIMEAIATRISCRAYADEQLDAEKHCRLETFIDQLNEESGLRFQLYGPRGEGQTAIDMSSAMFVGKVYCYAALVAPEDDISAEKAGYFGEKLVLFATQLGLGTCWVASTYDMETTRADVQPGEVVWSVVPIGYAMQKTPLKQKAIRAGLRKRDKPMAQMTTADMPLEELPEWYAAAIDAVYKGPSAVNGQPVTFDYRDGNVTVDFQHYRRKIEIVDMGIAKLHFELGARANGVDGNWDWGAGSQFHYR